MLGKHQLLCGVRSCVHTTSPTRTRTLTLRSIPHSPYDREWNIKRATRSDERCSIPRPLSLDPRPLHWMGCYGDAERTLSFVAAQLHINSFSATRFAGITYNIGAGLTWSFGHIWSTKTWVVQNPSNIVPCHIGSTSLACFSRFRGWGG